MQSHDRGKSKPEVADEVQSRKRSKTRLLLPPQANPEAAEAALKQVIEEWVLPTLLRDFLEEHEISPKNRFSTERGY